MYKNFGFIWVVESFAQNDDLSIGSNVFYDFWYIDTPY